MKTKWILCFAAALVFSLLTTNALQAQRYQKLKYPINVKRVTDLPLKKPVLLRADLLMVDQIFEYQQNGKRYVAVRVANGGNLQAPGHQVELRTSWRVDYEHWTTVERFVTFNVPTLAPGAQHTLRYAIPDHEIHTNEGFGSNSVSLRFFADKPKNIPESNEINNIRTFYVPVVRN